MDPIVEFLKLAFKTEFTTPGGLVNLVVMGVLAIAVASPNPVPLILATYEFLSKTLDRFFHFLEKCMEFIASLAGADFEASEKPATYVAPQSDAQWKPQLVVGVLTLACAFGLAAVAS